MSFPYFLQDADPNTQNDWSSPPILLNDGESLAGATVTVVDSSDNPLVETSDTPMVVFDVSFDAMTDDQKTDQEISVSGNYWQITFWRNGGTSGVIYNIRFRYQTDSNPLRSFDLTRRLRCRQT